jgi:Kef-type K+ transport system membrane component KefB
MSCKGLVALVVVNFGYDYGVITPTLFAILVTRALLLTTCLIASSRPLMYE